MKKLKAFTLVEVIIVLTTFSLIIVLIVTAVTSYKKYLDLSKLQTIALNFTREGVEAMFQIRDTNWLQHQ
ncbi:MAG: type II secretion system GspH family protein [Patescibacteria group bacterium]|nr:type II secretion system GspH family protein [Patescibacteria group bacterium]